jgi:hypothetical protein
MKVGRRPEDLAGRRPDDQNLAQRSTVQDRSRRIPEVDILWLLSVTFGPRNLPNEYAGALASRRAR